MIIEFAVADVDAEFARIHDALDESVLEPTKMPWGNRSVLFRDPDGNLVNLFSRPAGSTTIRSHRYRWPEEGSAGLEW